MPTPSALIELRDHVSDIENGRRQTQIIAFDNAAIDARLPAGGLSRSALHEVLGSPNLADDAAATIFISGIAARLQGQVVWCLRWRDLFAPSLSLAGLHPDRVIFIECGDDKGVLTAMEEALRHAGLAGVIGELGKISITASKRLQLAAEKSSVPAFVLRRSSKLDEQPGGTAAMTRWRIRAAPSEALGLQSLGRARWKVDLERVRGGEPHSWIVEACDAQGRLALPADLADRSAAAEERQAAA